MTKVRARASLLLSTCFEGNYTEYSQDQSVPTISTSCLLIKAIRCEVAQLLVRM